MTALTDLQVSQLNNMNRASQKVQLGTRVKDAETNIATLSSLKHGKATVSAAQATANKVDISTGLSSVTGWIAQIYRAGVNVTNDAVFTAETGGVLRVADGASTLNLAENDIVMWFAW